MMYPKLTINKIAVVVILTSLCSSLFAQQKLPYHNKNLPIATRVKDLLSRMTVQEKAGQLNQLNGGAFTGPASQNTDQLNKTQQLKDGRVGSLLNVIGVADTRQAQQQAMQSRLGIPLLFGYDVIHGYKTIFPVPLAEACTWDVKGIESNSQVAAAEAAAGGIHWTFAPMCDITNDPRWGRIMEGVGEDTYYGGVISAARVRGLQGNLTTNKNIMACVKHFAAYGLVEAGKEYNFVDVGRTQLWNKYLPVYKAAVDAGAATVMNSFNLLDGVPASANKYLVNDVLKNQWKFKGFVVSDWGSFYETITHGYAADSADAALKCFAAGSMMDMESKVTVNYLPSLVASGKVKISEVDDAVGRILTQKFRLGLFENPYKYQDEQREKSEIFTPENRAIALQAAQKSIVLLKNENNILPLKTTQKVALIGYYAKSKNDMFDFWVAQGDTTQAVSVLDGLKKYNDNITYTDGYLPNNTTNAELIQQAVINAQTADVVILNIGISGKQAGEDRALTNLNISDGQLQLLQALQATGKPIIVLVSSARPLILTKVVPLASAILQTWILGTEHGNAVANTLYGSSNPSGKTVITFPRSIGQIPLYYNHTNSGRPLIPGTDPTWHNRYIDEVNEPLYPFGYGLSYTTYTYSKPTISAISITPNQNLTVTVKITNTGTVAGNEVVQLYIRDYTASIVRPIIELKAFDNIYLKAGESKVVSFTLVPKRDLSFYDATGKPVLEPGKFSVYVGANSANNQQLDFMLK